MSSKKTSPRNKNVKTSISSARTILKARMKSKSNRLKPETKKLNLSDSENSIALSYSVPVMMFSVERNYIDYGLNNEDRWWSKVKDKPEESRELEFERKITLLNGNEVRYIRKKPENKDQKKEFYIKNEQGQISNVDNFNVDLLPLYNIETVNEASNDDPVIICEGVPAADALDSLDFRAVGTFNATDVPSDEALEPLLGKQIFVWPDNDDVGVYYMIKVSKRLRELGAKHIKVIKWVDGPWRGDAANFEDSADQVKTLIQEAYEWSPRLVEKTDKGIKFSVPNSPYSLRSSYTPKNNRERLI